MYTGITLGVTPLLAMQSAPGVVTLTVALPAVHRAGLCVGGSIALDGVCFTVTAIKNDTVCVDVMEHTRAITTFSQCVVGQLLNYERSMTLGAELGGHLVSGHVDYSADVIVGPLEDEHDTCLRVAVPPAWYPYWFKKGFIAINGCSLTVASLDKAAGWAEMRLIPHTRQHTNLGNLRAGDRVNVEIDRQTQVIVDTVKAMQGTLRI